MGAVRKVCDQIEFVLPKDLYPYPKYHNILFDHHFAGETQKSKQ